MQHSRCSGCKRQQAKSNDNNFAAVMLCYEPTSKMPPKAADLAADLGPVRSCKKPPVRAPAAMEFHGSSCSMSIKLKAYDW